MSQEKQLERKYSLNVARLSPGKHQERFEIDQAFFSYFESPLAEKGNASVRVNIEKTATHMDVHFAIQGEIELACDRCGEPYLHQLDSTYRIIYSFDEEMDFEGDEVMFVNPMEPQLNLMQEFYDIIYLAVPFRKVPEKEIHLCEPQVLDLLGLDAQGNPLTDAEINETDEIVSEEEETLDPRWAALKKLKDQGKSGDQDLRL